MILSIIALFFIISFLIFWGLSSRRLWKGRWKHEKPQTAAFVFDSPRPVRQALSPFFSSPKERGEREKDGRALKRQVGSPARRPFFSRLKERERRVGDPTARPRQNSDVGGKLHHRLPKGKKRNKRGKKRDAKTKRRNSLKKSAQWKEKSFFLVMVFVIN